MFCVVFTVLFATKLQKISEFSNLMQTFALKIDFFNISLVS